MGREGLAGGRGGGLNCLQDRGIVLTGKGGRHVEYYISHKDRFVISIR